MLTFKTPDVLDQLDNDEIEHTGDCLHEPGDIMIDSDGVYCSWCGHSSNNKKAKEFAKRFLRYEEYLTVEFDTEKGTAEVVKL